VGTAYAEALVAGALPSRPAAAYTVDLIKVLKAIIAGENWEAVA